jgi:hypothetical protein
MVCRVVAEEEGGVSTQSTLFFSLVSIATTAVNRVAWYPRTRLTKSTTQCNYKREETQFLLKL